MKGIQGIEGFKREYRRLRGVLADYIDDSYRSRNFHGDILDFKSSKPVIFSGPSYDGTPFVEFQDGSFFFIVSERGQEFERVVGNAEQILFRVFKSLTSELAGNFELRNRVEGKDARRLRFSKQIELLGLLNPAWALSASKEHQEILYRHPFDDA